MRNRPTPIRATAGSVAMRDAKAILQQPLGP
jgi:hypothetical protein